MQLCPSQIFVKMKCLSRSSFIGFDTECQTYFHRDYGNIHPYQQCLTVPFVSHPHEQFLSSYFLILANLVYMQWYLIGLLICISLNDVEYCFVCLLGIWKSSKEMPFQIICPCFYLVVCLFRIELLELYIFLDLFCCCYSQIDKFKGLSLSVVCIFTLLMTFNNQKSWYVSLK